MSVSADDERYFWAVVWPKLEKGNWRLKKSVSEVDSGGKEGSPDKKGTPCRGTTVKSSGGGGGNSTSCSSKSKKSSNSSDDDTVIENTTYNQKPVAEVVQHAEPHEAGGDNHDEGYDNAAGTTAVAPLLPPLPSSTAAAAGRVKQQQVVAVVFFPPPPELANEALEEAMRRNLPADGSAGEERFEFFEGLDAMIELLTQVPGFPGTTSFGGAPDMTAITAAAEAVSVSRPIISAAGSGGHLSQHIVETTVGAAWTVLSV